MFWSITHPPNKELVAPTARPSVKDLLDEVLYSPISCDERLWWVVCSQREKFINIHDVWLQVRDVEGRVGF